jgi:hypothetical protein
MRFVRAIALLAFSVFIPLVASADTTGSVRGCVVPGGYRGRDYIKNLVHDAVVRFSGPSGIFAAHANSDGFYVIFGMPPGRYAISAEIPGYAFGLVPWIQHVCIHAGQNLYRNLAIGLTDLPIRSELEELDRKQQFRPDASQTADVYSIGDC